MNGDDDFANVDEEDEETFVTSSKRSAINTMRLPYVPPDLAAANVTTPDASVTLYLHVGPSHSGVPMLYEQLGKMGTLQQDRIVVANASHHKLNVEALHADCQNELMGTREKFESGIHFPGVFGNHPKTLAGVLRQEVACWKSFLDTLDAYRSLGTSVFISDDRLSQQVLPNVYGIGGAAALDWVSIKETLQADWNIVVIVNYRRYFDWLPAAKGADEQVHLVQHTAQLPRLARWPRNEDGMYLEPLFPHFIRNAMKKLDVPYSKRVVELYGGFARTRLLDLYVPDQSVLTTLLCNVLRNDAPASCAESQRLDATLSPEDKAASRVLDLEGEYKWFDFELFDELVTTAADHNILRFRHVTRRTATITTQYYIEQYMNIHPRRDLPLKCPKPGQLEDYLKTSLQYERELLGEQVAAAYKASHKAEFEQQVENRMFCAMNMRRLFRDPTWRTFLRHLTNKSAKRIQAGGKPGPPESSQPLHRLLKWIAGYRDNNYV